MATSPPQDPNLPGLPWPDGARAPGAEAEALSRAEIEAYVGANGRVYWDMLSASAASRSLWVGFNVPAAALPYFWLAYRKMFRECALLLVMGLIIMTLFNAIPDFEERPAFIVILVAHAAFFGLLGNGLYLRRIRIVAARVRRSEPDPGRRLSLLAAQGGTSWLAAVLLALGTVLLRLALRDWTRR